ncbi:glycosyltransferase [Terrabacter aerolatus]|uniref:4,4'-diaponeurosporenoate glycosyltransferase n=1 Tax=Terrabacter aerolatus TaxID=422442 RepID=A0A512D496_9MICO|nr:glycosyltransferase [Terrabacter aerolatus]GEO31080.1 hypothetical protein TAE01_28900 [Terrabacter aerolatus]
MTVTAALRASVVIPAHDEASVIQRLLDELTSGTRPSDETTPLDLEIVVACNGCSDGTARLVRERYPDVAVVETPVASKAIALDLGDRTATTFPRLYVDADVYIDRRSVADLVRAVNRPGVLAAAPERVLELDGSDVLVRWYHAVWELLPAVRTGLYGRGVIVVSREGHGHVSQRQDVMGDDLLVHHSFTPEERVIVSTATSHVWAPTRVQYLVRRRTRGAYGNHQLASLLGKETTTGRESFAFVTDLLIAEPSMFPKVVTFVAVTGWCRLAALRARRSKGGVAWLRDDSSRLRTEH